MATVTINYDARVKTFQKLLDVFTSLGAKIQKDDSEELKQKAKLRSQLFKAMDEAEAIKAKVKKQGSTKGIKTLDELLSELN